MIQFLGRRSHTEAVTGLHERIGIFISPGKAGRRVSTEIGEARYSQRMSAIAGRFPQEPASSGRQLSASQRPAVRRFATFIGFVEIIGVFTDFRLHSPTTSLRKRRCRRRSGGGTRRESSADGGGTCWKIGGVAIVEPEGDLLDAHGCSRQQAASLLQPEFLHVASRRNVRVVAEHLAEPRITHVHPPGHLVGRNVGVKLLAHDAPRAVDLPHHVQRHELVIRMVVHRHAQQQVGDAGQILLVGGAFVFGHLDGLVVEVDHLLADSDAKRPRGCRRRSRCGTARRRSGPGSRSSTRATRFAVGHVTVPAVGAQQHHVPGADADALAVGPVERPAARVI